MIPKTLVYVDSKNKAQGISSYLKRVLRETFNSKSIPYTEREIHSSVGVYTAVVPQRKRDKLIEVFKTGDCQILICTDAAGMGMDIRTVTRVVQFGISKHLTISDLVQRVGRCARDPKIHGVGLVMAQQSLFYGDRYVHCFPVCFYEWVAVP